MGNKLPVLQDFNFGDDVPSPVHPELMTVAGKVRIIVAGRFFRRFVEEKVWPVDLACYLVVCVDNKTLVGWGREAWLLINGGGT